MACCQRAGSTTGRADPLSFSTSDYSHYRRVDSDGSNCPSGHPLDIYWEMFAEHVELMLINVNHDGYVSVGWCEPGTYQPVRAEMAQRCTFISGGVVAPNSATCFDQFDYLDNRNANEVHHAGSPKRDIDFGGKHDVLDCAGQVSGGKAYVKMVRKLATGETSTMKARGTTHSKDTDIVNAPQWMVWAAGPTSFDCVAKFSSPLVSVNCDGMTHPGCGWQKFNWFTDNLVTTAPATTTTKPATAPPAATVPVWSTAVAHWTFDSVPLSDVIRNTVLTAQRGASIIGAPPAAVGAHSLNVINEAEATASSASQLASTSTNGDRFKISTGKLSHSLWFRCNRGGSDRCQGVLVWTRNGAVRVFDGLGENRGSIRFSLFHNRGTNDTASADLQSQWKDDAWHHVVAIYDGSAMTLFLDCRELSCAPIARLETGDSVGLDAPAAIAGDCGVVFGVRCQADAANSNAFRGLIDDYMLFDKALTRTEMLAIASRGPFAVITTQQSSTLVTSTSATPNVATTGTTATRESSTRATTTAPMTTAILPSVSTRPSIGGAWTEIDVVGERAFTLGWRHDGTQVEFEISAQTDGWIAVGWSHLEVDKAAGHVQVDAYVGSIDGSAVAHAINVYSVFDITQPQTNAKPLFVSAPRVSAVDGRTMMSFIRPLAVPSDASMNVAIENRDMLVLWAVGSDDIVRTPAGARCQANSVEANDSYCYKEHTHSGVLRLNLISGRAQSTSSMSATTISVVSSAAQAAICSIAAMFLCIASVSF